jgi:hypothetical protein
MVQTATENTAESHPYGIEFSPKQRENWEKHGRPVYDALGTPATEDIEATLTDISVERVRELYVATFRPKARNDGMMERDSTEGFGQENCLVKWLEQFGNPRGSIRGVVMADIGLSDEEEMEAINAATEIFVARQQARDRLGMAELRRAVNLHKRDLSVRGL